MNNIKMPESQYPTEEELEYMYEEYVKSGSFEDIFGIKENKDTEFQFQYNIIVTKIIYQLCRGDGLPRDFFMYT